jgi:hypothetical protein
MEEMINNRCRGDVMENLYGNYIGEDIEVVILKKYTLVYINDKRKNDMESYLLYTENFLCKAACISKANTWIEKEQAVKISFFRNIEGNAYTNNQELAKIHDMTLFKVDYRGDCFVFTLYDGRVFLTERQESYNEGVLIPGNQEANKDNIALCLKEWTLGLRERYADNAVVGIEFNSPKHMYIFFITDGFIYARAARYGTCRQGVVFTQNFRQNFHDLTGQSYALRDNTEALEDVKINPDLFAPDACVYDRNNIYWSVSKVEPDAIYLNGCDETYIWTRPTVQAYRYN